MAEEGEPCIEDSNLNICVLCASSLKDKNPKLLPCLHTLCENCLNSLFQVQIQQKRPVDENGDKTDDKNDNASLENCTILCPACNGTVEKQTVVDNLFVNVPPNPIVIEEDEEEKEVHNCTGCDEDENENATSFCLDCKEWLCDQCVIAHRRVKMTKDHTIQPKDEVKKSDTDNDDENSSSHKIVYCKVHKREPLKLFCNTCDKLTCRDCQLLEHKDHKYQFLSEAIVNQREILQMAVVKLKQKMGNYQQADKILSTKNSELRVKLDDVCQSIKDVSASVVKEINNHADKLVQYLENYIKTKTNTITEKQKLVESALENMKHAIEFVENALTIGDDTSILFTKGLMMKSLRQLSNAGIPFHPSILNYSITFEHEKEYLLMNAYRAGSLVIDNTKYSGDTKPATSTNQSRPNASQSVVSSARPPAVTNIPSSTQSFFPGGPIPSRIQERWKHLPPEQQRELQKKLFEKFHHPQNSAAGSSALSGHYSNPHANASNSVNSSLQNLSTLVNGHLQSTSYPQTSFHQIQQPYGTHFSQPMQPRQPAPYSRSHPQGMQRPARFPNTIQYLPNHMGGAMATGAQNPVFVGSGNVNNRVSSNIQNNSQQPRHSSWNVDSGNRSKMSATSHTEMRSSPGAQAAAHHNKTPSPAGAGFDQSSAIAAVLSGSAHGSTQHGEINPISQRLETKSSTQAGSTSTSTMDVPISQNPPVLHPNVITEPSVQSTIPPLIHVNQLQGPPVAPATGGKQMPEVKEEDPNEDYCAVCQNGGDLLCCDFCPKVFHLKCHIPELKDFASDDWGCTLCSKDLVIQEPEKKDFGILGPGKRKAPSGLTEKELKTCERILLELYCHKDSTVFHEPVSKAVPNYYKIIAKPMDFGKIKVKLQRQNFNHYNSVEEFLSDCKLVFTNCLTYNAIGTPVYEQGKILDEEFERLVKKFLPCYVDILDDLATRKTPTPLSDSSDGAPGEKKKKKRYEDDPDTILHIS